MTNYTKRELQSYAVRMADRFHLDPDIFLRQIEAESSWDPKAVNENSGAAGLGQVMADTARDPGFGVDPLEDRFDPLESIRFAAEYMDALLSRTAGDYALALAAYNKSPTQVLDTQEVPDVKETIDYIAKILGEDRPKRRGTRAPRLRPNEMAGSVAGGVDRSAIAAALAEAEMMMGDSPAPLRPADSDIRVALMEAMQSRGR